MLNSQLIIFYFIASIFLFFGRPVMSADTDFEQSMLGKFMKEINYTALALQHQNLRQINMDWRVQLARVKDEQGQIWQGQFQAPYIESFGQGYLRGGFQSGNKKISIVVTSLLANDWKGRLDYVVQQLANTNRSSVNAKLIPSTADLYFVPKDTPGSTFCSFMLADFYVDVSALDAEADVMPLALAILNVMLRHSQHIPAAESKKFTLSPKHYQGAINAELSVVVSGLASDWVVQQPSALLPAGIVRTGGDKNTFTFKASSAGKIFIPFVSMNTHSLKLSAESVEVVIQ
jgi:hypothetical protein